MLVLSRKLQESVRISHCGEILDITVIKVRKKGVVRLGFSGPLNFVINRSEPVRKNTHSKKYGRG